MMRLLAAVERLRLPDAWIGAGFVRNAVWDALHGRRIDCTSLGDVDVVFFDPADARPEREAVIEAELWAACPDAPPWSARNQARMHRQNGDPPYRDTEDALRHWPETATAVAVRSARGGSGVELIAPHGVADLLNLVVRPTPAFMTAKIEIYRCRVHSKNWLARSPRLVTLGLDGD
ncbi:MAG TPA: nucleotidyltransferase family protein [Stellaceae bacterium]